MGKQNNFIFLWRGAYLNAGHTVRPGTPVTGTLENTVTYLLNFLILLIDKITIKIVFLIMYNCIFYQARLI